MDAERWRRLRALFDEVQKLPEGEREAFLDRQLAGDPEFRADLDSLLAADASAAEFLAEGGAPAVGSMVGPYRLLEPLGEGGFGIVHSAEQLQPIRRRVALKLIKPGMDTRQVIARFETERQVLALMDHPGIAHVFDAGETELGRPYFVMEYVPGDAITTFCDREKLPIRERLGLFLQMCDAIHHAHQKGVIHRDIKPSNVLVCRRDGIPALKVIDFGIAKATGTSLMDERTLTHQGMTVGTVSYMSPEQLGAVEAAVDTRTDIYSLGVVLFELLAGDLPYERTRLRGAAWTDVVRMIREENPPSPAALVARSDTPDVARRRSTDSRSLQRELKGELGWITLRALEKEPDRRYSSAADLAADVRRYLAHEPVLAAAPSTTYRLRKYARRHRVGVTAAAVVLLAIIAGGIVSAVGFRRAVRAERAARREAEASSQVADFLVKLFHASSPDKSRGAVLTARSLLDEGTHQIETDVKSDPHVRARLLGAMGDSYLNLGAFDEGLRLTRAALAASQSAHPRDDLEVARQLDKLANALSMAGEPDSIPVLVDRTIALLKASGKQDPHLLAMCYYRKAREVMQHGNLAAADSLMTLALGAEESLPEPQAITLTRLYSLQGSIANYRLDLKGAERNFLRSLEFAQKGDEPTRMAATYGSLASIYASLNEPDTAVAYARKGVDLTRRLYAPDHQSVAIALSSLTQALMGQERYAEAISVEREAVGILRPKAKPEMLAFDLDVLGTLYHYTGQMDSAIAYTAEAAEAYRVSVGPDNFRTADAVASLARCYDDEGKANPADSLYCAAIDMFRRGGDQGVLTAEALRDYAGFCREHRSAARADSFYTRAVAALDSTIDGMKPILGQTLIGRARLRSKQNRPAEAESLMTAGFRLEKGDGSADEKQLGDAYLAWAEVRIRAGNPEGAIERLRCAVRCGMTAKDVRDYPVLAALRSRTDYPFDSSR